MRIRLSFLVSYAVMAACTLATNVTRADEAAAAAALAAFKVEFQEHGRIGVLGAITDDVWKGGLVFEHEYFEAQILTHLSFAPHRTRDVHLIFKLGGRANLGALNYFAFGAEYGPHPGAREDGVSVASAYVLGPYISLQRYFAATPLMLNLWVNPVMLDHEVTVDENRHAVGANTLRVLQTGGFGLAYLF